ncbi:MAG: PAS domain-containing protein [Gemmatimonadaceae bacterium]|nr:PAS domain-containing protein [Gemmatimonadaceae bacterium]
MTLPNRSPSQEKRTAVAGLTPRSLFSYWRLTWRHLTAVFGPPLVVLVVGVAAYEGTARLVASRIEGRQSRAISDAANRLVFLLTDAETGQRGFLLTGKENYLKSYALALDSLPAVRSQLHVAITTARHNASTPLELDSLSTFSMERMAELAETISIRRASGLAPALAIVNTNRGRDYMTEARRIATALRDRETARVAERTNDIIRYTNWVTWVVIFGTGAAFLIALLVNVLLARDAATQTRLAAERDEANQDLATQKHNVEEQAVELHHQAQELEAANEELIASNEELQATSEELQQQTALAEEARQEATGILESIGDAFFALDRDWKFIYLNDNAEPLLGLTRAELLGESIWEAFPDAVGTTFEREYRRAINEQVVTGFEEYFEPLDKWFQVRAYPWRRGLAVYFTDVSSRVRAERSFRALAETMPQLVWSTDASGASEYFNGRWLAYTGADTPTPTDGNWRTSLHPADTRDVDEKWHRSFPSGDPFEVEARLRRGGDGAYRWFLCRALPLRDETGKITRWFGTCTDVHDQRRSAEGLSVLAEASAILATSVDTDAAMRSVAELAVPRLGDWCTIDLLDASGSLRRIATVHSEPAKLAIADEFNRRFPAKPEDPGSVFEVLRTGVVHSSEITDEMIIAGVADIEKREMLLALGLRSYVIAPMMVDGAAVGAITIVSAESGHFLGPSDIARVQELARRAALALERTRLFAETVSARDAESLSNTLLRESEAKLVLSMEAGGLGSWEWDIKADRVSWSPQTERMHGLAEGAFSGSREEFGSYIHPDDRERVASEIARTLAERTPTYHIKYRFLRTDGEVRWLEGFARLRTDENGEPVSFLGVSHDVTAREQLLEAEQQARQEAEAANAAKAIFLTTMSHELRTPLNAVSGYVDLLEMGVRGPVTDLQREDLRRIRRASQHLLVLINDILNYARLEAGSVELHLAEVTLTDALEGMEALIAPQLQAKGVQYEYKPCDSSVRVRVDREKLDQILLNLVGNAVKFTESDGRITLSCEIDGAIARVIVEDTGRGIPRGKLKMIFDPFVQVDRHLTPERQQGVGLGLAISRDLARAMNGDISVQSDAGKGATFVLTLPISKPEAASVGRKGEVERV